MVLNPRDPRDPMFGVDFGENAQFRGGAYEGLEYGGPQMDPRNAVSAGAPAAPSPQYPEKPTYVYERTWGENRARQGALRFQEGIETDRDIPANFVEGITAGNDMNITHRKWPQETLRERAHPGSAAWIEAPSMLGNFANGAGEPPQTTPYEFRDGGRQARINPVRVSG